MTKQHFNVRHVGDFETGHSLYDLKDLHEENPDTRVAYNLGRKPLDYVSDYVNGNADDQMIKAFEDLLSRHGISEVNETTIPVISQAARDDLFGIVLTDDFVDEIAHDAISKIKHSQNKGQNIDQVRVVAPFPVDPDETANELTPAFAVAFTLALEERMPHLLEQSGLPRDISVVAELDRDVIHEDDMILNIAKNGRSNINVYGDTSDQTEAHMLEYASGLARQPVYSGPVHTNAVYVPLDDNLFGQTTLASLSSYVQSHGAPVTASVTVARWAEGVQDLTLKEETLEFLNQVIEDLPEEQTRHIGGFEGAQEKLQLVLAKVGLSVDFDDLQKNSLSNMEGLFLASAFADSENPDHQEMYDRALDVIGSDRRIFEGTIPDYAMYGPPANINHLDDAFKATFEGRHIIISEDSPRFADLEERGGVTSYELEAS